MPDLPQNRSEARVTSVFLGGFLAAGWALHDHAVFASSGDPRGALELVGPSLTAIVLGSVLGFLLGSGWRLALSVLALLLAAAVLPSLVPVPLSELHRICLRSYALIGLGLVAGRVAEARLGLSPVRYGLCVGLLLCVAKTAYRMPQPQPGWWQYTAAASVALVAGLVPRRALRLGLTLAAAALPLFWMGPRIAHTWGPPRIDRTLRTGSAREGSPSLLLVVLDTVRADHLSAYGYEHPTTPGLELFAARHATRYTDVRSPASWTLPSHASLLTGLPPAEHGATHPRSAQQEVVSVAMRPAQPLRQDVVTLAERLAAAGYRTGAVLANHAYLDYRFGLDQGFEHYDARPPTFVRNYVALGQTTGLGLRIGHTVYRDAERITDLALSWLGEETDRKVPFFLLLNYMDAHEPHYPPAPYDRLFAPEVPDDPLKVPRTLTELLYDRSLAYVDAQVTRLLTWLETDGRFQDTVVVVTADHGEAFGDHGFWTHAWTLYDELLRVPLLVKPAGPRTESENGRPTTLLDVHDMALELVGLGAAPREPGEVIAEWYHPEHAPPVEIQRWARERGRALDADLATWVDGDSTKWIVGSDGSVEAYDLARDPGELEPLALPEERLEAARARARSWWTEHPPRAILMEELDDSLLEGMRDLGYVGDDDGSG